MVSYLSGTSRIQFEATLNNFKFDAIGVVMALQSIIMNLFRIFITLGDFQAPHVCVMAWVPFELIQGLLPVMCISSGCKCLFIVYASCYESCLVSHDVSIYYMMELRTSLQVLILHPRLHSS